MNRLSVRFIFASLLVPVFILLNSFPQAQAHVSNKVTICHSTGSASNPYVSNQPSKSADVQGHDGHDGGVYPADPWGDIIPPFSYNCQVIDVAAHWTAWTNGGQHGGGTTEERWVPETYKWICPVNEHSYNSTNSGKPCSMYQGHPIHAFRYADKIKVVDVAGHFEHRHWIADTYTSGSCEYPGKNWTPDGQAIYDNGCEYTAPDPTPTPTPTMGPSGPTGLSGDTGPSGSTGDSGSTGETGVSGQSGPTGSTGDTGCDGASCNTGGSGESGPTGVTGESGSTGPGGESGPTGSSGTESTPTPTPTPAGTGGTDVTTTSGGGSGDPKSCSDEKPGTPTMYPPVRLDPTTMKLSWSATDKATTYALSYGVCAGQFIYGVADTGNVTEFTVGGLNASQTYYFSVRAINGCMPGDSSNTEPQGDVLGTGIGGADVLGATTLAATGTADVTTAWYAITVGMVCITISAYGIRIQAQKIRPQVS